YATGREFPILPETPTERLVECEKAANTRPRGHPLMGKLRTWRWLHAGDIIAEVKPVEGIGTWEASAWLVVEPSKVERAPRSFSMLTEAQSVADALAATAFGHQCTATCGTWLARAR